MKTPPYDDGEQGRVRITSGDNTWVAVGRCRGCDGSKLQSIHAQAVSTANISSMRITNNTAQAYFSGINNTTMRNPLICDIQLDEIFQGASLGPYVDYEFTQLFESAEMFQFFLGR